MGLFRSRKSSSPPERSDSPSWTSRINLFSRFSTPAAPRPPSPSPPQIFPDIPMRCTLQRANTMSSVSQLSMMASNASSRPPSLISTNTSPTASSAPPLPKRTNSTYSHRSLSIRRDSMRLPSALPKPAPLAAPPIPMEAHEDGLVLTSTSQYPTGIAAELYIPEDCTYHRVMERQKEYRRSELKSSLKRNGSIIRRNSGINTPEEKKRLKRLSVNF